MPASALSRPHHQIGGAAAPVKHQVTLWPAGPAGLAAARGWAAPAAPACAAGAPEKRHPAQHPCQTRCANAILAVRTQAAGRRTACATGPISGVRAACGTACPYGLGVHASCGRCALAPVPSRSMPRAASPQCAALGETVSCGCLAAEIELRFLPFNPTVAVPVLSGREEDADRQALPVPAIGPAAWNTTAELGPQL